MDYSKRNNKFCSRSCSNSFTNLNKIVSKNTKDKISFAISSKKYLINCKKCKLEFLAKSLLKNFCNKCQKEKKNKYYNYPNTRLQKDYLRNILKSKGEYIEKRGGLREKGGKVKKYFNIKDSNNKEACLNKEELLLVNYLIENNIQWIRNLLGFKYIDKEEKLKKFYPDFFLPEYHLYLEYKGWVLPHMIHKMNDAQKRNNFKLLIVYSSKFKNLGIQIHEIKDYINCLCRSKDRT